jgi:hypothetical protein
VIRRQMLFKLGFRDCFARDLRKKPSQYDSSKGQLWGKKNHCIDVRFQFPIMQIVKRPVVLLHIAKEIKPEIKQSVSKNVDSVLSQAEKHQINQSEAKACYEQEYHYVRHGSPQIYPPDSISSRTARVEILYLFHHFKS